MTAIRCVMRGALAGKTIGRILFNRAIERAAREISGRVLDIAGGREPSYLRFLPKDIDLVRTDLHASDGVVALDMNRSLPYQDGSFDTVLLFSALYAAEDPQMLAREVHRVLKSGGRWLISSPFIANEMSEPHDYVRFTAEGLERLCRTAGFASVNIERIGERASAATHILQPFFLFNIIRAFVFPLAIFFDWLIPSSVRAAHPSPISYFVRCTK